jgi:hypothetical protein
MEQAGLIHTECMPVLVMGPSWSKPCRGFPVWRTSGGHGFAQLLASLSNNVTNFLSIPLVSAPTMGAEASGIETGLTTPIAHLL